jgi:hypothetical protein
MRPALSKTISVIALITTLTWSNVFSQNKSVETNETRDEIIYASTQPVKGFKPFVYELQRFLTQQDSVGKTHRFRLNNIGFIVGKTGKVDSTWVIFHHRPIHDEIMKFIETTYWVPARHEGQPVASVQEMDIEIYLTKAALKRHRSWRSMLERIISPWSH